MDVRRTNGFVRVLRIGFGFIDIRFRRNIIHTELFPDISTGSIGRGFSNAKRVRTHIGDKTLNTAEFAAELNTFVQFLSDPHGLLRLHSEFL